jgi:hypothetical protein
MFGSDVGDKIEVKTFNEEGFVALGIVRLAEFNFM